MDAKNLEEATHLVGKDQAFEGGLYVACAVRIRLCQSGGSRFDAEPRQPLALL